MVVSSASRTCAARDPDGVRGNAGPLPPMGLGARFDWRKSATWALRVKVDDSTLHKRSFAQRDKGNLSRFKSCPRITNALDVQKQRA